MPTWLATQVARIVRKIRLSINSVEIFLSDSRIISKQRGCEGVVCNTFCSKCLTITKTKDRWKTGRETDRLTDTSMARGYVLDVQTIFKTILYSRYYEHSMCNVLERYLAGIIIPGVCFILEMVLLRWWSIFLYKFLCSIRRKMNSDQKLWS